MAGTQSVAASIVVGGPRTGQVGRVRSGQVRSGAACGKPTMTWKPWTAFRVDTRRRSSLPQVSKCTVDTRSRNERNSGRCADGSRKVESALGSAVQCSVSGVEWSIAAVCQWSLLCGSLCLRTLLRVDARSLARPAGHSARGLAAKPRDKGRSVRSALPAGGPGAAQYTSGRISAPTHGAASPDWVPNRLGAAGHASLEGQGIARCSGRRSSQFRSKLPTNPLTASPDFDAPTEMRRS